MARKGSPEYVAARRAVISYERRIDTRKLDRIDHPDHRHELARLHRAAGALATHSRSEQDYHTDAARRHTETAYNMSAGNDEPGEKHERGSLLTHLRSRAVSAGSAPDTHGQHSPTPHDPAPVQTGQRGGTFTLTASGHKDYHKR